MTEVDVGDTPITMNITLNADAVIAPALRSMRLSSELMSIGLSALETADLANPAPLAAGFVALGFQTPEDPAAKKSLYQAWLLAKGFHELSKGLRATLEEAYLYVMVPKQLAGPNTLDGVTTGIRAIRTKGNKLNFPDLVAAVEMELNSPLHFAQEFGSMQRARNCLEHRNGVVGQTDLDQDADVMRLLLPRLSVVVERDGAEIEVAAQFHIEAGEVIQIKRATRSREFGLGEVVSFDATQFQEVALACWFFANDIGTKLPRFGKAAAPAEETNQ